MGGSVRFGRYLLERRLAIGGMAEVFLGRIEGPEGFEKKVVIKRILPHLQHDANHVEMFLDEARLAARFNHPNLIQVYELARIDDQYSLAMEYIEGEDVAAILDASLRRGRKTPVEIAAFIAAGAAEGLHYVHELRTDDGEPLNVVHRDISPANIIVTWSGGVKIVDFGIAKHEIATSQTTAGTLKGKFSYMSPEQARRKRVDRRSDIFSLGAIFYELLTVSPCFTGPNQIEILEAVTTVQYVPALELRSDIDPELVRILDKMLAADVDDRYATAADVNRDLRRWLARTTIPTATDVGDFLANLFGRSAGRHPKRVRTSIQDWDEVPVTEDLSSPKVTPDEHSHRKLVDSQSLDLDEMEGLLGDGQQPNGGPLPAEEKDLEPFNIPPSLLQESRGTGRRRRSTLSHVADRLREPRYWPTTLAIMAVTLLVAACVLVMVYRAAVGEPWKPSEIVPVLVGGGERAPTPDEVVGAVALHIETVPSGARITVDGDVEDERTPLTVDNLAVDLPHTIVAEIAGHVTVRKTVTLSGTQMKALTLTLPRDNGVPGAAAPVSAAVKSDPPGALILINGERTAKRTPATFELEVGRSYVFSAELDGHVASECLVTAAAGEAVDVVIPLRPAAGTGDGYLTLDSSPRTDVFIAGRKVGSTPLRRHQLPAGPILVQLKHNRLGLSKTLKLTIPPNDILQRKVAFRKGSVRFDVRPSADVYLRRKKLGTTPMRPVTLYEGTYAIRLVNSKIGVEKTIQVTVRGGKTKKVVERLR